MIIITTTVKNGNGLMVMSRGSLKPPGVRMRRGSGRMKKVKRTSKKRAVAKRSRRSRTCEENCPCQKTAQHYILNHVSIPQHVRGMY